MDFSIFLESGTWVALLSLTLLEIILGVDNIVFISIISNKLPQDKQPQARTIGLFMAMLFRIILLFGITWVLQMQEPLFTVDKSWIEGAFSGQSIILLLGGLFLLYKSVYEIHEKLEGYQGENNKKISNSLVNVIIQIAFLNIIFSFDSILTAIGLTKELIIMILAVIISIVVMMIFAGPVSRFVNNHPTVQILGLSFLILIGFMLVAESAHLAHFKIQDISVGNVPKGYLYFAIFFSLFVEFLNLKMRKSKPVNLKYSEELDSNFKIAKKDDLA